MAKSELRQEWETRIADFRASGQSGAAWCAAHNIRPNQLWYWLKKIKSAENPSITQTQWVSVEINESDPTGNGLLIKVGPAVIEVQPGFNPALLKEVVQTLKVC
ncbi:IS66 family insertion sequence element accessory protein TnpA [Desulfoscipio gibsoniae]|uniref:Transposase n=1 Tax=Desulfoscipio gibsoniae DSM 7213 TaxID=767817 RepID=R4KIU9_9FIRM|nr:hypothetical protein [Desulfoscipio gibsoniae]AGL02524.1 hypothetical protein Desgi_3169 [Desulfoscipio gibsoniae DSM 7213]AGL03196.1 hypothetical protein Desgi_3893 [Desulfoscipio gibsoniae DSM 7213]AGL03697.1 hypothetical protein Desgi_4464 [Desulfoscipio gibsoniae DSM 7213]